MNRNFDKIRNKQINSDKHTWQLKATALANFNLLEILYVQVLSYLFCP